MASAKLIESAGEPADEADRGRHPGFARHEGLAGGPGSLSLSFGGVRRDGLDRRTSSVATLMSNPEIDSMDQWYIARGKVKAGPYSHAQLQVLTGKGEL